MTSIALGVLLYELLCGGSIRGWKVMMISGYLHEEPRLPRRVNDKIPRPRDNLPQSDGKGTGGAIEPHRRPGGRFATVSPGEVIAARPVSRLERAWKRQSVGLGFTSMLMTSAIAALALVTMAVGLLIPRLDYRRHTNRPIRLGSSRSRRNRPRSSSELALKPLAPRRNSTSISTASYWRNTNGKATTFQQTEQLLDLCGADLRGWEWHYLKRLCRSELYTFRGHSGPVYAAAFGPNDRWVTSASSDKTIVVWDLSARGNSHT